jgi:tetraacyldisaccharide 4'-kinase
MVSTAQEVGDEAAMIATRFPHIPVAVAEDRAAGAAKLLEETSFQVLILDDAFQHWGIHRDLDIVMLPASLKPWQKLLLPAGNLREPVSALRRADLVVVNRIKSESQRKHIKGSLYKRKLYKNQFEPNVCFTHYSPSRLVPFSPSFPQIPINRIGKRACLAFSGLANNGQFAEDLQEIGFLIIDHLVYPDHYTYVFADWKYMTKKFKKVTGKESYTESPIIITTEKDYQRLRANPWFQREAASYPVYYLETELEIVNGLAQFDVVFDELLNSASERVDKRQ